MRCLLYHFCAQEIGDDNLNILHSEYEAPSGRRFDLVLAVGKTGGVAIELKCGVHTDRIRNINPDLLIIL